MLYILDKDGSIKLSEYIQTGWEVEALKNGNETILHMTKVVYGSPLAGDLKWVRDFYYNISEDGITLALDIDRNDYNGSPSAWGKYVDGNSVHLTEEEYNSERKTLINGYTVVKSVDFDSDVNSWPDISFDFEDELDGFAQFISDEKI